MTFPLPAAPCAFHKKLEWVISILLRTRRLCHGSFIKYNLHVPDIATSLSLPSWQCHVVCWCGESLVKCGGDLVKVWRKFGESVGMVWWKFGESVVKVWWKCGESLVKWAVPFAKVLLSLESSNSLFVTLFVHCITCPELPWAALVMLWWNTHLM